jgi:hypothetical protein
MNLGQIVLAMFLTYISKSATAKVGNYQLIAADATGAPVHLTASNILLAYEQFQASGTSSVQSGNTLISVTKLA